MDITTSILTLAVAAIVFWAVWKFVLPKADLNGDGKVNSADLDVNKDGKVNAADAVKAVKKTAARAKKVATKAAAKTKAKK